MARIGITQQDVYLAANKLLKETGKTPTVDSVREKLGTGSRTTINNYLKTWKEATTKQEIAGIPAHLVQSLQTVYEQIKTDFAQELSKVRDAHALLVRNLHDKNSDLKKELEGTIRIHIELQQSLDHEKETRKQVEQQSTLLSKELAISREKLNQIEHFKDYLEKDNMQLKLSKEETLRQLRAKENLVSESFKDVEVLKGHVSHCKEKILLLKGEIAKNDDAHDRLLSSERDKFNLIKISCDESKKEIVSLQKLLSTSTGSKSKKRPIRKKNAAKK